MSDVDLQQRLNSIETYFEFFKHDKDMQIMAQKLRDLYQQPAESIAVE